MHLSFINPKVLIYIVRVTVVLHCDHPVHIEQLSPDFYHFFQYQSPSSAVSFVPISSRSPTTYLLLTEPDRLSIPVTSRFRAILPSSPYPYLASSSSPRRLSSSVVVRPHSSNRPLTPPHVLTIPETLPHPTRPLFPQFAVPVSVLIRVKRKTHLLHP